MAHVVVQSCVNNTSAHRDRVGLKISKEKLPILAHFDILGMFWVWSKCKYFTRMRLVHSARTRLFIDFGPKSIGVFWVWSKTENFHSIGPSVHRFIHWFRTQEQHSSSTRRTATVQRAFAQFVLLHARQSNSGRFHCQPRTICSWLIEDFVLKRQKNQTHVMLNIDCFVLTRLDFFVKRQ